MLDEYQRDEAILHLQRGMVLERANRVEEAVEEYRRAIARYPHLREAHDALGSYYQRNGLLAKAAAEFSFVANLEDDFYAYFNLGYVLLELGRHEQALAAFYRCLSHSPDDPAAHYEIAYLKYINGAYLEALNHLQIANLTYKEDWEIFKLRGRCLLRLGRFDEAQYALELARQYALRPASHAEVEADLAALARHRIIAAPLSLQDKLYADHGVVQLGSAQDAGLALNEAPEYHFTYPDIAMTLSRLVALAQHCHWPFTSVVALDRLAQPIATALGTQLGLPLRTTKTLDPQEIPLLVLAVGREAELLDLMRERGPARAISFCLCLNWLRHSQTLADIVGVVARGACSVPWEPELRRLRAVGAPTEQIERCLEFAATQITTATAELASSRDCEAQVAYYAERSTLLPFTGR